MKRSTFIWQSCMLIVFFCLPFQIGMAQHAFERPAWPDDAPRPVATPKADSISEALRTRPIVRAVVEKHEVEIANRIISHQRIEHVYSGPAELVGQVFKDISVGSIIPEGGRDVAHLADPTLEVGQSGIWMLVPWEDTWVRETRRSLGTWWPARPNVDPRLGPNYENVRMLAEALETVWQADNENDRIELLKGYALNDVSEVAVGATRLLAEIVPDELEQLVRGAELHDAPLRAQIAIDEAMMQHDREQWQGSRQHRQLLATWLISAIDDEDDTRLILTRLGSATLRKQIDPQDLHDIVMPIITGELRIAMKGEPHSPEIRGAAIMLLRHIVNNQDLRDDIVTRMLDLLDDDDEVQVYRSVAHVLVLQQVEEFDEHELARLRHARDRSVELTEEQEPHRMTREKRMASILEDIVRRHQPDNS